MSQIIEHWETYMPEAKAIAWGNRPIWDPNRGISAVASFVMVVDVFVHFDSVRRVNFFPCESDFRLSKSWIPFRDILYLSLLLFARCQTSVPCVIRLSFFCCACPFSALLFSFSPVRVIIATSTTYGATLPFLFPPLSLYFYYPVLNILYCTRKHFVVILFVRLLFSPLFFCVLFSLSCAFCWKDVLSCYGIESVIKNVLSFMSKPSIKLFQLARARALCLSSNLKRQQSCVVLFSRDRCPLLHAPRESQAMSTEGDIQTFSLTISRDGWRHHFGDVNSFVSLLLTSQFASLKRLVTLRQTRLRSALVPMGAVTRWSFLYFVSLSIHLTKNRWLGIHQML